MTDPGHLETVTYVECTAALTSTWTDATTGQFRHRTVVRCQRHEPHETHRARLDNGNGQVQMLEWP